MQQIFGGEMRRSIGGLGQLGDLPALRQAIGRLGPLATQQPAKTDRDRPPGKQLAPEAVDLTTIGCVHEVNKGCFAHELDLDGQHRMMAPASAYPGPLSPTPIPFPMTPVLPVQCPPAPRPRPQPTPTQIVEAIVATENHQPMLSLRAARQQLGWTQSLVAFEAGVSPATVSRAERDPAGCSWEVLRKIAQALGGELDRPTLGLRPGGEVGRG
jgi:DNA-binding XRE family transcriptional regulator